MRGNRNFPAFVLLAKFRQFITEIYFSSLVSTVAARYMSFCILKAISLKKSASLEICNQFSPRRCDKAVYFAIKNYKNVCHSNGRFHESQCTCLKRNAEAIFDEPTYWGFKLSVDLEEEEIPVSEMPGSKLSYMRTNKPNPYHCHKILLLVYYLFRWSALIK